MTAHCESVARAITCAHGLSQPLEPAGRERVPTSLVVVNRSARGLPTFCPQTAHKTHDLP